MKYVKLTLTYLPNIFIFTLKHGIFLTERTNKQWQSKHSMKFLLAGLMRLTECSNMHARSHLEKLELGRKNISLHQAPKRRCVCTCVGRGSGGGGLGSWVLHTLQKLIVHINYANWFLSYSNNVCM